jgi:hypothetical protein
LRQLPYSIDWTPILQFMFFNLLNSPPNFLWYVDLPPSQADSNTIQATISRIRIPLYLHHSLSLRDSSRREKQRQGTRSRRKETRDCRDQALRTEHVDKIPARSDTWCGGQYVFVFVCDCWVQGSDISRSGEECTRRFLGVDECGLEAVACN